jgi:hypothetical protein
MLPLSRGLGPLAAYARDLEGEGISERYVFQSLEATRGTSMTRLHIGM